MKPSTDELRSAGEALANATLIGGDAQMRAARDLLVTTQQFVADARAAGWADKHALEVVLEALAGTRGPDCRDRITKAMELVMEQHVADGPSNA